MATPDNAESPSETLQTLAKRALDVTKKAHKHSKSLAGDNFYGNTLATLRADATNAFRDLQSLSTGDVTAIAELLNAVFSPTTDKKHRAEAVQELCYNLRTTWRSAPAAREDEGLFPLSILAQTKRGYLTTVGRQMNGCFTAGWFDAAAVMMRRVLEIAIIEAFEGKNVAAAIRNASGDYLQLTDLIAKTLAEPTLTLSRNAKRALPRLMDVGHKSAHGRYFTAKKADLEDVKADCRIAIEELLHHAGLL
jgi:hypothetical protein